jgi:hypothetical protein
MCPPFAFFLTDPLCCHVRFEAKKRPAGWSRRLLLWVDFSSDGSWNRISRTRYEKGRK